MEVWSWSASMTAKYAPLADAHHGGVHLNTLDPYYFSTTFVKGGGYLFAGTPIHVPERVVSPFAHEGENLKQHAAGKARRRSKKFAEILAKATRALGSQEEAEQWLKRPAIGLDRQRPVDLLTTPAGVKLVEDYLGRLEYDVYT